MFSLEMHKHIPPKYSFALKDLASFLGIFEVSEEELQQRRKEFSETSSNVSYSTQGPFKPRDGKLDIIKENEDHDESDFEDQKPQPIVQDETGIEVGERVRNGVNKFLNPDKGDRGSKS